MPYHLSNFKRFSLMLFLVGCFLWTKRDSFNGLHCNKAAPSSALVEFGPMPMLPDIPMMQDFPPTKDILLKEQQELIEQKLQLRDDLLKKVMEKRNRLKID
jgi:hypothetical protein